ncbi:SpoIVB peptidase [Halolactibacillus miurensis]|uniref:SpoIVB peptidase n=2 Tax=Halolactibacillus TaxID=306539 RepID=A0A1I6PTL6_9BACI|nr:SpoIVB peptidase [Halolactibacillus miurensis]GEM04439.1 SpoIVB peptidase [Halolactibacillus miurensis]SFS43554.1 stage IV sporulation protein B [Halolactibacillus miurensis]
MIKRLNLALFVFLTVLTMVFPMALTIHAESLPRSQLSQKNEKEAGTFTVVDVTLAQNDVPALTTKVRQISQQLIPSGQSIGMQIEGSGVVIVGFEELSYNNEKVSPAKDAGCEVGDIIVSINGTDIRKMSDVTTSLKALPEEKDLTMELLRKGEKIAIHLTPIQDDQDVSRLGLLIQDQLSGVGTLTYIDPETKSYGGLGHNIYPLDQQTENVEEGLIFYSFVDRINKSAKNEPGEKEAHFLAEKGVLGAIRQHSVFGIFGELTEVNGAILGLDPIPVAKPSEVEVGPAEFLTVISGEKIERFTCEVIDVSEQTTPAIKSFIIKLTDERLIEKTGGIVQGMSGSPIIQNGKLIGAVTHVFVNDPLKGYGVHLEWMLSVQQQHQEEAA